MKTKKQEAQERLNSIENEVKELKKIINSPDSIFDRIKTFDDVCEELGTSSTEFFNKFYFVLTDECLHPDTLPSFLNFIISCNRSLLDI